MTPPAPDVPTVSVVILNYNGARWLERCLDSLAGQTNARQIEVIVADNQSTDGSDHLAAKRMEGLPNGRFIQHGANLGYCEGNNRAAAVARGEFLFFLNNDTWLEPDCIARLVDEVVHAQADAGCPLILDYDSDAFQSAGAGGFDMFGLSTARAPLPRTSEVFMPEGCAYLIRRDVFECLGGFDPVLFMYSDELDLSWRLWMAGHKAVSVPSARIHHRGAANVNPEGAGKVVEFRTSETKRYYANRNGLLVVLKNAQHLLLLMALLQLGMLAIESIVALCLVRRWTFLNQSYLRAVRDCVRLFPLIRQERRRNAARRVRGDFWMLRFLRLRPNRWDELQRLSRFGIPKVSPQ